MKKLILSMALVASTIMFTGCGREVEDTTPSSSFKLSELSGLWRASNSDETISMMAYSEYDANPGDGVTIMEPAGANGTWLNMDGYKSALMFKISAVDIVIIQPNNIPVKRVNMEVLDHFITPRTAIEADEMNAKAYCNFTQWEEGVERNLQWCYFNNTRYGKTIYDEFQGVLIWGDRKQIGADGFPETLDTSKVFEGGPGPVSATVEDWNRREGP